MKSILCYGDSNTHGFIPASMQGRYPADVRWTGQLQSMLGADVRVIEEGLCGRTTVWNDPMEDFRSGKDYLIPCLVTHRPVDLVVLMLGTNDLKTRFSLTAADIANGCGALIEIVQSQAPLIQSYVPEILLISPMRVPASISESPFGDLFDGSSCEKRSGEFAKHFRETALRYGTEFLDAASIVEPSPDDSLHMSAEGHRIFAEALYEKIRTILFPACS